MSDESTQSERRRGAVSGGLERRLVVHIGLGLLAFSLVAGAISYALGYRYQLDAHQTMQQQLVRTVQGQAEVAAFAGNTKIASDIIEGLLTNPSIRAVRLEASEGFAQDGGASHGTNFANATAYPLYSPVDGKELIGTLHILRNDEQVGGEAARFALLLVAMMLLQVLIATALIIAVSRRVVSRPVERLAQAVAAIRIGSGMRLPVEDKHSADEIGVLTASGNSLIATAETALAEATAARHAAEAADRAKSEFLALMSHEMRTPLGGMIGMLNLTLRDDRLPAHLREQIRHAGSNAHALLSILNDLLDISKIESGKFTLEKIDFDLRETVREALALLTESAAHKGLLFAIDFEPDLPEFVVGDPMRLRQILINLAGNAVKFTERGEVRVSVRVQSREGARGVLAFSVQDTGIGIAGDAVARLFRKFEQADSSTSRRFGGTGLGLAICRQLVEGMGGSIGVQSAPGAGSTFSFTLPYAEGAAPKPKQLQHEAPHSHRLRVLCAEDFVTNQLIIRALLEQRGHEVDMVDTGVKAVAAAAATDYDAILMDGRMPEMDGIAATRIIRGGGGEQPVRDRDIPIIALTANVSAEDQGRWREAGMSAFLSKPIDEQALHRELSKVIERQLARGVALPPLAPSVAELDAMFGVDGAGGPGPAKAGTKPAAAEQADLAAMLRDAFCGDLPRRLLELDKALDSRDAEALGRLLHGLKGSAGYLDESGLRDLCAELEQAAGRGDWPAIDAAWPRLLERLRAYQ